MNYDEECMKLTEENKKLRTAIEGFVKWGEHLPARMEDASGLIDSLYKYLHALRAPSATQEGHTAAKNRGYAVGLSGWIGHLKGVIS